jgi:hypothetical protein
MCRNNEWRRRESNSTTSALQDAPIAGSHGLIPATGDLGWAFVAPRTGRVLELGVVHQDPDPALAKSTDRETRVHVQGARYREFVRRHGITAIAAEAAIFNPRRFVMAVGCSAASPGSFGRAGPP